MKNHSKDEAMNRGGRLSRRGFAAGIVAGIGLLAGRALERAKVATHLSMKEAAYYEPLDAKPRDEQ